MARIASIALALGLLALASGCCSPCGGRPLAFNNTYNPVYPTAYAPSYTTAAMPSYTTAAMPSYNYAPQMQTGCNCSSGVAPF